MQEGSMDTDRRDHLSRYAVVASAVLLALLAAFRLVVGTPWEVSDGTTTRTVNEPYWPALLQLLFSGLMLAGVYEGRRNLVWVGAICAVAYGVLQVFSARFEFLLVALACLASTAIRYRNP
jgi:hypothetical protein